MEPTLFSNNVLLTDRISPRLNRIDRGDIIIAKCPTNPQQHICKRVIGLPGDRIIARTDLMMSLTINHYKRNLYATEIRDDDLKTINNTSKLKSQIGSPNNTSSTNKALSAKSKDLIQIVQDETVTNVEKRVPLAEIVIPPGHVWIEGDNTKNSSDSRYYGPVPIGLIKSRVILRVWPVDQIKFLSS
ncbi:mitochondrial inner membrane protease subunit 1-like isoform X2 [Condylostylus longicornis]|nr:mitochondrial inner membrane protease subunit 1-like isoform X2 [Condylostylus longicornis]XP_055389780.1 mitochondrial inner membrane protease subunit 1-like isoform X2 [Condylostylus longicornis]